MDKSQKLIMIDTINLKKILSEEKDNNIKQIKNAAHEGLEKSLDSYKEEYKYTPLLRKIEKEFETLTPINEPIQNLDIYSKYVPKNEKYYCPCGHFNELGVKEVAWKRLKPCFDEYLKDS